MTMVRMNWLSLVGKLMVGVAFVSTLLAGAEVLATPKLGDWVVYERSFDGQVKDTVEIKLIGHKPESKLFYKQTTVRRNNQSEVTYEPISEHLLMSEEVIENTLQKCIPKGGTLENLVINHQVVLTCQKPLVEDQVMGAQWIGHIPFGLAKLDYESGMERIEMVVIDFGFGN